jgi:hypothetical protein
LFFRIFHMTACLDSPDEEFHNAPYIFGYTISRGKNNL